MSNSLKKRAHIRRVCRKCGTRLVTKEEYGILCPRCGWMFVLWTDFEAEREKEKTKLKEGDDEQNI